MPFASPERSAYKMTIWLSQTAENLDGCNTTSRIVGPTFISDGYCASNIGMHLYANIVYLTKHSADTTSYKGRQMTQLT